MSLTDTAAARLMTKLIDSISSNVPKELVEVITLARTMKKGADDVLAHFQRPVPATARPKRSTDGSSTCA